MKQKDTSKADKQKRPLELKWKLAYLGIGAVFIAGLVIVVRQCVLPPNPDFHERTPRPDITDTPATLTDSAEPIVSAAPTTLEPMASPTPAPRDIQVPVLISFTKQRQECPIIPVGIGEGKVMDSPESATEAGWFYYSSPPGDAHNSVIVGHQAYGGKKGVFSVLKNMKQGEQVVIEFESGLQRFFEVERVESYLKEDVPTEYVTAGSGTATQLTLITCLGDYGLDGRSLSRVVVICKELLELRESGDPFIESE